VLLAFVLQLPLASPCLAQTGKPVPARRAAAASKAPWEAAWSQSIGTSDDLLLAVSRDHVFTASAATSLVARQADTGEVAWTHDAKGWRALVATATMIVGVAGNHAYGLDASTGQTRWVSETTGPAQQLVLAGDRVLMLSESDALLRDVATGTLLGRIATDGPTVAQALTPQATILAFADGRVALFDIPAGLRLWQVTLRRPPAALAAVDDAIYVAAPDGTLQALSARNGTVRWSFPLRVPIVGEPFAGDRFVHVILLDNSMRTFDRRSGAMLRTDGLGHRPAAGPWVTGDLAVVGLTTGEFIVLNPATGRIETRLRVPEGDVANVLESAAIGPDTFWLASITIAPGGERRLAAYRHNPPVSVTTEEELVMPSLPGMPDMESSPSPALPESGQVQNDQQPGDHEEPEGPETEPVEEVPAEEDPAEVPLVPELPLPPRDAPPVAPAGQTPAPRPFPLP
jgi:outer membrane protein assembly factor BamB